MTEASFNENIVTQFIRAEFSFGRRIARKSLRAIKIGAFTACWLASVFSLEVCRGVEFGKGKGGKGKEVMLLLGSEKGVMLLLCIIPIPLLSFSKQALSIHLSR